MRGSKRKQGKIKRNSLSRIEAIQLYSLFIPAAIVIIIFMYLPMYGLTIAFRNYSAGDPFFALTNAKWIGLKNFERFFKSIYFERLIGNTLRLSLLNLGFGFTIPILFALLLNEVRQLRFKKLVQTASYLPYFISTVVVAGMVLDFVRMDGLVNQLIGLLGIQRQEWVVNPKAFPAMYTITNVWKNFGFSSILYFSTISGIDATLYEAARIDGANRFQQMIYVTLPGIMYIIAVQLVLQMGSILKANTDLILLLYKPSTYKTADIIGTYVYREGVMGGKFSYTMAISLFMSVIGFSLTFITNKISNRLTGHGLW